MVSVKMQQIEEFEPSGLRYLRTLTVNKDKVLSGTYRLYPDLLENPAAVFEQEVFISNQGDVVWSGTSIVRMHLKFSSASDKVLYAFPCRFASLKTPESSLCVILNDRLAFYCDNGSVYELPLVFGVDHGWALPDGCIIRRVGKDSDPATPVFYSILHPLDLPVPLLVQYRQESPRPLVCSLLALDSLTGRLVLSNGTDIFAGIVRSPPVIADAVEESRLLADMHCQVVGDALYDDFCTPYECH